MNTCNVELIADGVHVHPAVMRIAMAAKRPDGVLADHRRHGGVRAAARKPHAARATNP